MKNHLHWLILIENKILGYCLAKISYLDGYSFRNPLYIQNNILLFSQYLVPASTNCLQIDRGLVEALNIKISNSVILPENTWFDSICKFVYEKLKVNIN